MRSGSGMGGPGAGRSLWSLRLLRAAPDPPASGAAPSLFRYFLFLLVATSFPTSRRCQVSAFGLFFFFCSCHDRSTSLTNDNSLFVLTGLGNNFMYRVDDIFLQR